MRSSAKDCRSRSHGFTEYLRGEPALEFIPPPGTRLEAAITWPGSLLPPWQVHIVPYLVRASVMSFDLLALVKTLHLLAGGHALNRERGRGTGFGASRVRDSMTA